MKDIIDLLNIRPFLTEDWHILWKFAKDWHILWKFSKFYLLWFLNHRNTRPLTISASARSFVRFIARTRRQKCSNSASFPKADREVTFVAEPNVWQVTRIFKNFVVKMLCHSHTSHFLFLCQVQTITSQVKPPIHSGQNATDPWFWLPSHICDILKRDLTLNFVLIISCW